jgi:hypothetical protein
MQGKVAGCLRLTAATVELRDPASREMVQIPSLPARERDTAVRCSPPPCPLSRSMQRSIPIAPLPECSVSRKAALGSGVLLCMGSRSRALDDSVLVLPKALVQRPVVRTVAAGHARHAAEGPIAVGAGEAA